MPRVQPPRALRTLAAVCLLSMLTLADAAAQGEQHVLVLGVIQDDADVARARLRPMADYIRLQLAAVGITDVRIATAQDRYHMQSLLQHGRVDWLSETSYHALLLESAKVAEILARTWRDGSPNYRSLFFVRNDSPIFSMEDLHSTRVAFEQPGSTSAFVVPALALMELAMPLCQLAHPRAAPGADCANYVFAGNSFNTAAWVHKKIVDVGAVSSSDWNSEETMPAGFKQDFRILYETEPLPRGVEMVRADLDEKIKTRLREVLISMHDDPSANAALAAYFNTRKFDALRDDDSAKLERLRAALPDFIKSAN